MENDAGGAPSPLRKKVRLRVYGGMELAACTEHPLPSLPLKGEEL
jgi:hypothetical protein